MRKRTRGYCHPRTYAELASSVLAEGEPRGLELRRLNGYVRKGVEAAIILALDLNDKVFADAREYWINPVHSGLTEAERRATGL